MVPWCTATKLEFNMAKTETSESKVLATEIQDINSALIERAALFAKLAADSTAVGAHAFSEMLRPLFAWNPQASQKPFSESIEPALTRLNETARSLFSWNPQNRRP